MGDDIPMPTCAFQMIFSLADHFGGGWAVGNCPLPSPRQPNGCPIGCCTPAGSAAGAQELNTNETSRRIENDIQHAKELQMSFTPGFAVGIVDAQGRMSVKKIIVGSQPISVFETVINDVLSANHGGD